MVAQPIADQDPDKQADLKVYQHVCDANPYEVEYEAFQVLLKCLERPASDSIYEVLLFLQRVLEEDQARYRRLEKIIINCGFSIITKVGDVNYVAGISFSHEHGSPRYYQDDEM